MAKITIINQLGPILLSLSMMFLTVGSIHFLILRRQRNKYPIETWATVRFCKEYKGKFKRVTRTYHALILNFVADNKNYNVRRDVGIRQGIGEKSKSYTVGEQVKIYYDPENPEDIDLEINNSYKVASILSCVFIFTGLVGLLVGSYLTFYYN